MTKKEKNILKQQIANTFFRCNVAEFADVVFGDKPNLQEVAKYTEQLNALQSLCNELGVSEIFAEVAEANAKIVATNLQEREALKAKGVL